MVVTNNYYVNRLSQALITLWAVITISFGLIKSLPGGPEAYIIAQLATTGGRDYETVRKMVEEHLSLVPDKPVHEQYIDYMTSILQGDLGRSIYFSEPVAPLLAQWLPWTVFYASLSLFIAYAIALVLGSFLAYYESTRFDYFGSAISITVNSVPYYAVALLCLFIFGYQLGFFPSGGKYDAAYEVSLLNLDFVISALYHAILPAFSIIVTAFGGIALAMRGNAIQVLGSDFMRVASLRGLSSTRISTRYVLRNAVLPLYTRLLISIGYVIGGSVVLEEIFRYQAIGYYLLQAISTRDAPLMMGAFIAISSAVIVGVFIADMTYGLLDPRASEVENRETY